MELHRFGISFRIFVGEILDLNEELENDKKITSDAMMQLLYDYVTQESNLKDVYENIKSFCDKYKNKKEIINLGICIINEINISAFTDEIKARVKKVWNDLNKKKKQNVLKNMKQVLESIYGISVFQD